MTPEMLIAAAICLPVIIAAGIAAAGKFPNLREGVTLAQLLQVQARAGLASDRVM